MLGGGIPAAPSAGGSTRHKMTGGGKNGNEGVWSRFTKYQEKGEAPLMKEEPTNPSVEESFKKRSKLA